MSMKKRVGLRTPTDFDNSLEAFESRIRFGLNFDAVAEMVALARHPDATISQRIKATEIIMDRLHPKQRATAPTPGEGEVIEVNIVSASDPKADEVRERIAARLAAAKENEAGE